MARHAAIPGRPVLRGMDAYGQDLGVQIQSAEIHLGLRAGFMPEKVRYGASHRPFVGSVFSGDPDLEELRREFELALNKEDSAEARELSEKIGSELVNRTAIQEIGNDVWNRYGPNYGTRPASRG